MVVAHGPKAKIGYIEETTWGTTPTTPTLKELPHILSDSLRIKSAAIRSAANKPDRVATLAKASKYDAGGAVSAEFDIDALGTLLKHALGGLTTTGVGPYTHVFKGASSLPAGLSIEKQFPDISEYLLFKGARINNLTLTIPEEGPIPHQYEFLSKEAVRSTTSVTAQALTDLRDGVVDTYLAAFLVDGAAAGYIISGEVAVNNNLDGNVYVCNSRLRYGLGEGERITNGRFRIWTENLTLLNKFLSGTSGSFKITFTRGTKSAEIFLPAIYYIGEFGPGIEPGKSLPQDIPFEAVKDATEATDIKITLINSISAY